MADYWVASGIEIENIRTVEDVLESKIEWLKENEGSAKREIRDLETALYEVRELYFELE